MRRRMGTGGAGTAQTKPNSGQNGAVVEQPTVLIISDDADFSRAITAHWQMERSVPAFTLMSSDLCRGLNVESFDLAIIDAVPSAVLERAVVVLESLAKPVVCVADSAAAKRLREAHARVTVLPKYEGWLDALVPLACEVLRRVEAFGRACRAEQANRTLRQTAILGRYMLEMRHPVNNALTSVLGNSELLLAEPGSLSAAGRAQLETIRHMALRIHEILQRFSSLEKELSFVEKPVEQDTGRTQAMAANS